MVKMKAPAVVRAKSVDSTESAIRAQYKKIAELVTRKQQAESARARLRTLKEKATISTSSKYLKGKQVQLLKKMVRLKKPVAKPLARHLSIDSLKRSLGDAQTTLTRAAEMSRQRIQGAKQGDFSTIKANEAATRAGADIRIEKLLNKQTGDTISSRQGDIQKNILNSAMQPLFIGAKGKGALGALKRAKDKVARLNGKKYEPITDKPPSFADVLAKAERDAALLKQDAQKAGEGAKKAQEDINTSDPYYHGLERTVVKPTKPAHEPINTRSPDELAASRKGLGDELVAAKNEQEGAARASNKADEDAAAANRARTEAERVLDGENANLNQLKGARPREVTGRVDPTREALEGAGKVKNDNGRQEGLTRGELDGINGELVGAGKRGGKNDGDVIDAAAKEGQAAKDMDAAKTDHGGKEGQVRDAEAIADGLAKPDRAPVDAAADAAAKAKPQQPKSILTRLKDIILRLMEKIGLRKGRQTELTRGKSSAELEKGTTNFKKGILVKRIGILRDRRKRQLAQKEKVKGTRDGLKAKKAEIDAMEAKQADNALKKGQYGDSVANHLDVNRVFEIQGISTNGEILIRTDIKAEQTTAALTLKSKGMNYFFRGKPNRGKAAKSKVQELEGTLKGKEGRLADAEAALKGAKDARDGLGNLLNEGRGKLPRIKDEAVAAEKAAKNEQDGIDALGPYNKDLGRIVVEPTKPAHEPINTRSPDELAASRKSLGDELVAAKNEQDAAARANTKADEDAAAANRARTEAERVLDGENANLNQLKGARPREVTGRVDPTREALEGAGKVRNDNGRQEGLTRAELDGINGELVGAGKRGGKNDGDVIDAAAKEAQAAKDMDAAKTDHGGKEGQVRDAEAIADGLAKPDRAPVDAAAKAAAKAKPEGPRSVAKNEMPLRNARVTKETMKARQERAAQNRRDADAAKQRHLANKGRLRANLKEVGARLGRQEGNLNKAKKIGDELRQKVARLRTEEGGQLGKLGGKNRNLTDVKLVITTRGIVDGVVQTDLPLTKIFAKRVELTNILKAVAGRAKGPRPQRNIKGRTKELEGALKSKEGKLADAEAALKGAKDARDGLGNLLNEGRAKLPRIKDEADAAQKAAKNEQDGIDALGPYNKDLGRIVVEPTKPAHEPINTRSPDELAASRKGLGDELVAAKNEQDAAARASNKADEDAAAANRARTEAERMLDGENANLNQLKGARPREVTGRVDPTREALEGAGKVKNDNGRQEGLTRGELDGINGELVGAGKRGGKNDGDVINAAAKEAQAAKDMDAAKKDHNGKEGQVRDAEAIADGLAKPDRAPVDAAAKAAAKAKPEPPKSILSRLKDIISGLKGKFKTLQERINIYLKNRAEAAKERARKRELAKKLKEEEMRKKKEEEKEAKRKKKEEEEALKELKKQRAKKEGEIRAAKRRLILIFGGLMLIIIFLKPTPSGTPPSLPIIYNNLPNEKPVADISGQTHRPSPSGPTNKTSSGPNNTTPGGPSPPTPIVWPSIDCIVGSAQYLRGCRDGARQGANDGGRDGYNDQIANAKRILPYTLGEVDVIAASTIRFTSYQQQNAFCRQVVLEGVPLGYTLYMLYPSCNFNPTVPNKPRGPSGPSGPSAALGPSGPSGPMPGYGYGYGYGNGYGYGDYGAGDTTPGEENPGEENPGEENPGENDVLQEGGLIQIARGESVDYRAGYLFGYNLAYAACYPTGWALAKSGTPVTFLPPPPPPPPGQPSRRFLGGPSGASGAMPGYGYGYGYGDGYEDYEDYGPNETIPFTDLLNTQEGGKIKGYSKKKSVALLNKLVGKTTPQSVRAT